MTADLARIPAAPLQRAIAAGPEPEWTAGSAVEWRRIDQAVAVQVAHLFAAIHPQATLPDPDLEPTIVMLRDEAGRWVRFRVSVESLDGAPW